MKPYSLNRRAERHVQYWDLEQIGTNTKHRRKFKKAARQASKKAIKEDK